MTSLPEIQLLTADDAPELAAVLQSADPDYIGHFHPFPFSVGVIREHLVSLGKDRWWALRSDGELAGFFFLRGFDEGYERPAFGLFVAQTYRGRGFGKAAIEHALDWCRSHGVGKVMLKVHPENDRARAIYAQAGFTPIGPCSRTGHMMMEACLSEMTTNGASPAK